MDIKLTSNIDTSNILLEQNADQLANISNQKTSDAKAIKKVAQDFESIFFEMVLKSMRQSIEKSGFIDGGNAEDIYRSMLDGEYSKMVSIGGKESSLASTIERQLLDKMGVNRSGEANKNALLGKKVYENEASQRIATIIKK